MLRPPYQLKAGPVDRWFTSLELLSLFPSWPGFAKDAIQWLWNQRSPEGFWDFGPRPTSSVALRLSESWRRKAARRFDWTTRVLVLLWRFHANSRSQAANESRWLRSSQASAPVV